MGRDTGVIVVVILLIVAVLYFAGGRGPAPPPLMISPPLVDPNAPVEPEVNSPVTGLPGPLFAVEQPSGFVSGIIHGLLAPIMLVLSLFMANVRMYDFENVGIRYDLGFLLGFVVLLAVTSFPRWRRW